MKGPYLLAITDNQLGRLMDGDDYFSARPL